MNTLSLKLMRSMYWLGVESRITRKLVMVDLLNKQAIISVRDGTSWTHSAGARNSSMSERCW